MPVTGLREGHFGYTRGFVPRFVSLDSRMSDAELRESNVAGPILQGLAAQSGGWSVLEIIEIVLRRARAAELRESGLREELGRISRDLADEMRRANLWSTEVEKLRDCRVRDYTMPYDDGKRVKYEPEVTRSRVQPTQRVFGYEDHGYVGSTTRHETTYGSLPRGSSTNVGASALASRTPIPDPYASRSRIPGAYESAGIRDPYARYLSIPEQYVTRDGTGGQYRNTYPRGEQG